MNMSTGKPSPIVHNPDLDLDPVPTLAIVLVGSAIFIITSLWVWAAFLFYNRIRSQEIQRQADDARWEVVFGRLSETSRHRDRTTVQESQWLRSRAAEMANQDSNWDGETLGSDSASSYSHVGWTLSINSSCPSTTEASSEVDDPEPYVHFYGTFDDPGLQVRHLDVGEQEPGDDMNRVLTWIRHDSWSGHLVGRHLDEESDRHS
ncbi:hypothetical protein PV10_01013 [Exophiala mesophila]|uniref:Uncharacterized protein n=1 Tax=Exophiala mesophila TaxID=212818 RepID=A0A0D1Y965_EXOME|nr:uncharacterized protein PV10_01013 [Exophiala mesophila]KIV97241.1 hypothetical protein PV10_01013 [Exophiala mesophila]